ncbi:hypothetical protein AAF712_009720 [Marasmius tenuissimus]|uniref:Uncharacterized protein n=1 Tax=Marasmius tenuissimus TaxID=585030 RepID=A0ABR2ZP22_9AGAR
MSGSTSATPTPIASRRGTQRQNQSLPNRTLGEDLDDLVGGAIGPSRTPRASKKPKKNPRQVHRILRDELNDDQKRVRTALLLWLRVLWRILDSSEAPFCPTTAELDEFRKFFDDEMALDNASSPDAAPLINPELVDLPTRMELLVSYRSNTTVTNATALPEWFLESSRLTLAKLGLKRWCVDLAAQPDSLYNKACERAALETFGHGLLCGAFQHLSSPRKLAGDRNLHSQLYHHIVFQYFMGKWLEVERHGNDSLAEQNKRIVIYKNRLNLSRSRYKFLQASGYPSRYLILADPKATSDDEEVPGTKAFKVKKRPERSKPAEAWYRRLDEAMKQAAAFGGGPKLRKRFVPDVPEDSLAEKLPTGMPLDYFDPQFFCQLPPGARHAAVMGKGEGEGDVKEIVKLKGKLRLAFLEEPGLSLGLGTSEIRAMEKLPDIEFFNQRREKVLPLYDLEFDPDANMDTS